MSIRGFARNLQACIPKVVARDEHSFTVLASYSIKRITLYESLPANRHLCHAIYPRALSSLFQNNKLNQDINQKHKFKTAVKSPLSISTATLKYAINLFQISLYVKPAQ